MVGSTSTIDQVLLAQFNIKDDARRYKVELKELGTSAEELDHLYTTHVAAVCKRDQKVYLELQLKGLKVMLELRKYDTKWAKQTPKKVWDDIEADIAALTKRLAKLRHKS